MPSIETTGVEIYYEVLGSGPPLLIIGGFSTHHLLYKKSLGSLAENFTLIVFDNRGSGKSSTPKPPYTIKEMAQDASTLITALHFPSLYVMGFSMGSLIATALAIHHPRQIKKAILGTPFAKLPPTALMQLQTTKKLIEARTDMRLVIETTIPWLYSNRVIEKKELREEAIKRMEENPYPQSFEGYLGQEAALQCSHLEKELSKIKTPILLLAGEEDLLTPVSCAKFLHESLPNSQLKVIESVGHMLPIEKPNRVIEEAKRFFQEP